MTPMTIQNKQSMTSSCTPSCISEVACVPWLWCVERGGGGVGGEHGLPLPGLRSPLS
jgi:hypothetical protein